MRLGLPALLLLLSVVVLSCFLSEAPAVQVAEAVKIFGRKKKDKKGSEKDDSDKKGKKQKTNKKRSGTHDDDDGTEVDKIFGT